MMLNCGNTRIFPASARDLLDPGIDDKVALKLVRS
jgi:hypothetical protein